MGPLSHHEVETYESVTKHVLPLCNLENESDVGTHKKYITMPLVLNSLQSFGVLQFESIHSLSREDLRFLNSISNLLAITLDRFNKKEEISRVKQNEICKRAGELDLANGHVRELENERVLREQFVSILTHDLRTPLTAAKISAQLIMKYPDKTENNKVLASRIVSNIERMDQMIQDLLDVSRIRAGESLIFVMNSCDLRLIAIETLKELSVAYGDRFVLQSDRLPIVGFWNADGIRRVIENLVTNAVKYGASQEPIIITIKSLGEEVQIIVHNSGNPISEDEQKFLFRPFQRATSAQMSENKGWGLGLTLVRGVVEAHGGAIKVSSSEKDGTSFLITIPQDSRPFSFPQPKDH